MENALKQNNKEDFDQSIGHFLTLRYGTNNPNLVRADSLLKRLTISRAPSFQTKLRSTTTNCPLPSSNRFSAHKESDVCRTYTVGTGSTFRYSAAVMSEQETNTSTEVYEPMDNTNGENDLELHSSESEDDGYTFMYRGRKYRQQEDDHVPKEDNESDCGGKEAESIEGKGEISDLVYETVENSPRYVSRSCSQDNLDDVNG